MTSFVNETATPQVIDMDDDRPGRRRSGRDARQAERAAMVRVIARRGVRDPRVLEAMGAVPRHRFVPEELTGRAYDDTPLRIGRGQVITQPSLVAAMVEAASLNPEDTVLEVGTGSGYGAAILGQLARRVFTIERFAEFAERARRRFDALGYDKIVVRQGDGTLGWPEHAPYEAIVVTAGSPPSIPEPLLEQLAVGGRLVIPVGAVPREQELLRITRTGAADFEREVLGDAYFVPLIGERGWGEPEADG